MNDTAASYKDRKGMLMFTGIMEFLIGLVCVGFAGLTLLGAVINTTGGQEIAEANLQGMYTGAIFYALLATGFIWLGIGTLQTKRWARDIGLVVSALWLAGGVSAMCFMLYTMPKMAEAMSVAEGGHASPKVIWAIQVFTLVFTAITYVLIPALLLLVYRSPHVKATCEARDPKPGWTSRCPLPVLAVVCCLAWGVPASLMMLGYNMLPFFGTLLTGPAAAGGIILLAAACAVLMVWTYKLKPLGLYGTVGLVTLMSVSGLITFTKVPTEEYYEIMGMAEESAQMAEIYNWQDPVMIGWMAAWSLIVLGYLIYVRKYFLPPVPQFPAQG